MYIKEMKMNPQYVIVSSVILLFIFFITIFSSKSFTPYDEKTVFSHMYPYEGFEQFHHKTEYTLNSTGKDDTMKSFLIGGDSTDCKKVYGLDGLFCSPNAKIDKIDVFGDVKGDPTCSGKSSGLSNSKGALCLNSTQLNLLRTRGGNQAGLPSQIGN
jgi:hypothetical protein